MTLAYEEVSCLSAQGYIDQLRKAALTQSETARPVVQALLETVELALEKREALAADDMPYNGSMLDGLSLRQRAKMINQYSLGLGSCTAPVVFVGSEHAYNLEDTLPFSLEAIGLTILWLCGGKADVTTRLSSVEWCYDVPFHIHPNALYRVHESKRGEYTWKVLADIMAMATGISDRRELLAGCQPGLGDLAYQVELSAYPARRASQGKEPTHKRLEFLASLLAAMSSTVRVLVFHGRHRQEPWRSIQLGLAKSFLGLTAGEELFQNTIDVDGVEIRQVTHGSREVLFTRALNGSVSADYRRYIGEMIKGILQK